MADIASPLMNFLEETEASSMLVKDLFIGACNNACHDGNGHGGAPELLLDHILEWPTNYCEWSGLLFKSDELLINNSEEKTGIMEPSNITIVPEVQDMADVARSSRDAKIWDAASSYGSSKCIMDVDEDEVAFAKSCITALKHPVSIPRPRSVTSHVNYGKRMLVAQPYSCSQTVHVSGHGEDECQAMPRPKGRSAHDLTTLRAVRAKPSTESNRRKNITRHFGALRALFPSLLIPQNDKCKLIDHTCQYIGELENKIKKLQTKTKILKRMSLNKQRQQQHQLVSLSIDRDQITHMQVVSSCGGKVVNISLGCYGGKLSFCTLLRILDMQGLDVLNANCSLSCNTTLYAIQSKVKDPSSSFSSWDVEKLQMELKIRA